MCNAKPLRILSFALLAIALMPVPISAQMVPVPLAARIGKKRPLLIFSPHSEDPRSRQQFDLLQSGSHPLAGAEERDLVLYDLPLEMPEDGSLSAKEASAARKRFHIAPADFTVILLGKDGGEKLRDHSPVPAQKLFDLIDSMPMRQDEMRQRASASAHP